jgi:hypothetical protein
MKVAIIANTGLGDGLWMMIVAHNFHRHGHNVTLYNDYLYHLRSLFEVPVELYSPPSADLIISQQYAPGPRGERIEKETLDQSKTYVQNLRDLCITRFNLPHSTTDLGLKIPAHWRHRANPRRVILHPVTANGWKDWPRKKFIRLATLLQNDGFEPQFVGTRQDMAHFPSPLSLDWLSLAQFIYESGHLIGNDGSLGHLASAFHIPTLSLFDRKSRATFWRPGWGPGNVILPYPLLPGRFLIKKFWKQFLTVKRVHNQFCNKNI